ncbi:cell wall-associated NlpC family hydrolase [Streptomyces sp. LBL]|uniref:C40 family peptidase n=1 Tax=Streptomyces sp. LBL TaxID=2940562 RepID=UPI002475A369|nr:C40 family peptidase [Streptomyces sp. LBL]MDH6623639.1 cell wall-associated NlpC family hydrolase [Streptomyces sp. LBL]
MAAHRKPRRRSVSGNPVRAVATIALAGAATATGFDGTGLAAPQPAPTQVKAEVNKLYREAEVATEKYNGAREKTEAAEHRLSTLRDEAARRTERLNSARDALGSTARAQYRDGGLDPALQLALSADPDQYLDGAEFVERAGNRQASSAASVRRQLREIEQLRGAARIELTSLTSRQAELRRHRTTINGKLTAARRLLSRLSAEDRARLGQGAGFGENGGFGEGAGFEEGAGSARAARSARAAQDGLSATGTATSDTPNPDTPNSRAAAAVSFAYAKLGSPYVWGATGPDAFDCSGLVLSAYRAAGVSLPRTTYAQIGAGRRVSRSELLPGDLVFFYSGISHVGLYVGNGQMIHAPNPSAPVRLASISEMPFAGATRVG